MLAVCVARYDCSVIINNQLNMMEQPFSDLSINYWVAVMIPLSPHLRGQSLLMCVYFEHVDNWALY